MIDLTTQPLRVLSLWQPWASLMARGIKLWETRSWSTDYRGLVVRSDEDRALHDHPWSFLVIPLWRGYIEHSEGWKRCFMCDGTGRLEWTDGRICTFCDQTGRLRAPHERRVLPLLGMRFRRATYRHRVELIEGQASWSLFFRFRETRVWGFWLRSGFKPWNLFWQEKCV